ncbi:response regulator [Cronbergia sp. UHCC 0137]|uniref:hybrid sensor histidine kinase/response regulator n=1 Tax=Cronbergia sp. UHCC 0137 TaxID=3110239 RepID=UPI002B2129C1|nr:response regulator [Cronbergia sp. UHCC 0137]MEA5619558.1 response regulator [Cronbergia sp. UHCC 0137]
MEQLVSLLVVDDEPDNFDVIEALLLNDKYQLNYASSGIKALERMNIIQPDLILLDVMMPEMNGIETCKAIKANPQWQHIPIIIVTALNAKEDLAMCIASGADDFISKPVNKTELQARVRSMLRIKQHHDDLQGLIQLREDMVNMLVHDLRNPLTNILLCAEIAKLPKFTPEVKLQKIDRIIVDVKELQSMIDSLLYIAKFESGKMRLNLTEVDINKLCNCVLSDFELLAAQRDIQLIGHLAEINSSVNLDSALFRRVLDNLIANAIKFSPNHSQVILQADYSSDRQLIVQVIDTGKGISKHLQQAIFEKYEIGSINHGTSQTGLGLTFCKMVMDAHGGSMTVENNYPTGTIFTVKVGTTAN